MVIQDLRIFFDFHYYKNSFLKRAYLIFRGVFLKMSLRNGHRKFGFSEVFVRPPLLIK